MPFFLMFFTYLRYWLVQDIRYLAFLIFNEIRIMFIIILVLAIFIISLGISSIILPTVVKKNLENIIKKNWLWPVSVIRLILGVTFLFTANQCAAPIVIKTLGMIFITAAIVTPFIGRKKIDSIARWCLDQKDWAFRIWGFLAMLLGIFLALSGMPA